MSSAVSVTISGMSYRPALDLATPPQFQHAVLCGGLALALLLTSRRSRTKERPIHRRSVSVLGGVDSIERRLDAVRLCLGALYGSVVATRCRSLAGDAQLLPITGAAVTIHAAPDAIHAGVTAVGVDIWNGTGLHVTLIGRQVTSLGVDVAPIRGHVALYRVLQDPANTGVPLPTTAISLVGNGVSLVGQLITAIGGGIALVAQPVALVRCSLLFVHWTPSRQPARRQVVDVFHFRWVYRGAE
jgi:hypothetical protein